MDNIDKILDGVLESSLDDISDLDSLLIEGVDEEFTTSTESVSFDENEYDISAAEESAIFLDTLYSECESKDEFVQLVEENATLWEMYGLIEDATAATEAVKKMKIDNWKKVNLDRVAAREAIRVCQKEDAALFKKYTKHRALFKKYRDQILRKYGNKSRRIAKKSIANSAHKHASVQTNKAKA